MDISKSKAQFVRISLVFLVLIASAGMAVYLSGRKIQASPVHIETEKGPLYDTVFTIPNAPGPLNHLAATPDGNFIVVDNTAGQWMRFDQSGHLLSKIDLASLDILQVADIQATKTEIVLLEAADTGSMPIPYLIDRLTFDGRLLSKTPIPTDFAPDINLDIANYIEGILLDCSDNVYLQIPGTASLYAMDDIQQQKPLLNGLMCRDKIYRAEITSPGEARFMVGDQAYSSTASGQMVSLRLLHVFEDGGFLLERVDVMKGSPIQVDDTIHYIDAAGNEAGVARVPMSEVSSAQAQYISVSEDGQVYMILPREGASDVIRLNFYRQLDPLTPGAVAPSIERIAP